MGTGNQEYVDKLKDIAINLGISSKVFFVGFNSEASKVISSLDLLISSSNNEPFGRTIVEAMIQKTPVLAAYGGGHIETISQNVTGYLYDHESVDDFISQCGKCLNSSHEKDKIVEKAYILACSKYSSTQHTKSMVKIYQKMAQKWDV